MNEVEEQKKINFKGFKQVNYEFFLKVDKIRNISAVTYRILSFIFYSCIFYCEILGYLDVNTISKFNSIKFI